MHCEEYQISAYYNICEFNNWEINVFLQIVQFCLIWISSISMYVPDYPNLESIIGNFVTSEDTEQLKTFSIY